MTRTFKTLATIGLGVLLLTGAACEDQETQDALKTCKSDLSNVQKTLATQTPTMNTLKAQLAQAEAKVQELTKEKEAMNPAKGGKAEEKAKAGEAKKPEAAKANKKESKKGAKK